MTAIAEVPLKGIHRESNFGGKFYRCLPRLVGEGETGLKTYQYTRFTDRSLSITLQCEKEPPVALFRPGSQNEKNNFLIIADNPVKVRFPDSESSVYIDQGEFLVGPDYVEIERAEVVIAEGESLKKKAKLAIAKHGMVGKVFLTGYVDLITKFGNPNTDPQPHGIDHFEISGFENRVNGYKVDHLGSYTPEQFAQMTQSQQYYGRYVDFTDPRLEEEAKRWGRVKNKVIKEGEEEIVRRRHAQADQAEEARLLEEKRQYLEYLDQILRPKFVPIPTRAERRRERRAHMLTP